MAARYGRRASRSAAYERARSVGRRQTRGKRRRHCCRPLKRRAAVHNTDGNRAAILRDLFEAYVADLDVRGKSDQSIARAAQTGLAVERHLPALLNKPVLDITANDIAAFCRARPVSGMKPSTINRDLRTLSAMIRKANPELRFPRELFAQEEERVRWLTPAEEAAVFGALRGRVGDIIRFAAVTLMRLSEVLTLRRETVDRSNLIVRLPRAKPGPRPVILSQDAAAILAKNLDSMIDHGSFRTQMADHIAARM